MPCYPLHPTPFRRADPPLVSQEAQKRMIVLDPKGAGAGEGTKAGSNLAKGRDSTDAVDSQSNLVSDPLYPRTQIHMQWPAVRKVGSGLPNLGNTCFLNAVTQCLTHTPPLASFCLNGEHKKYGSGKSKSGSGGFNPVYEMGEHICRALNGGNGAIAPIGLVKNLRALSKTFRKGRQEDAHEFARCLLDAMHKKICDVSKPKAKEGSARSETSFVWQVFGGKLRSRVTCQTCTRHSDKYDGFMDLSLDIAKSKSVANALKSYVRVEVLDGQNKYKCEMGPGKPHMTRATKQFTVDVSPLILTIQLKRFEYVPFGRGKLNQMVEYPLELDLGCATSGAKQEGKGKGTKSMERVSSNDDSISNKYALFGVVVHSGSSMHSGHYYCYVKGATGLWYEMDDETVTQCSENVALKQRAYLLFYAKVGTGLDGGAGDRKSKNDKPAAAAEQAANATRATMQKANQELAAKRGEEEEKALETRKTQEKLVSSAKTETKSAKKAKTEKTTRSTRDDDDTPGSPSTSEHGSLKSPTHRGGKLLSSRDSARLRLMSKRMKRKIASPVKTRAARRAEKSAEKTVDMAEKEVKGFVPVKKRASVVQPRQPSDTKSVKKWLNREARNANVVGRGDKSGWDEDEDDKKNTKRHDAKENPGRDSFKRRRIYDDVDEEYDRGKISKHARRKEKNEKGFGKSKPKSNSSKRNPFQSKSVSKNKK